MNQTKNIVKAIIIVTVLILILLTTILILTKKESTNKDNSNIKSEDNTLIITDFETDCNLNYNVTEIQDFIVDDEYNRINYVLDAKEYFTVKEILNNYIKLLGNKNNEVINLMAPKYLQEFNITESNINYYIPQKDEHTENYYIDIENMFESQISDKTKLYIIEGNISIKYLSETYLLNVMIEMDTVNMLYNIYPSEYITKYKLNNLKIGDKISFVETEIANRNDLNKYVYSKITTEQYLANELFNDFSYKLQMNVNSAYQKLNSNYSKARFGSQESFVKYINSNKVNMALIKINRYKVYSSDNYTDYICTDQYNNYYIFRQKDGIMRYTVFLDTYTVELDAFKKEYESATEESKIRTQVEKIAEMVNRKDYNALYNKLNSTFKQNNFSNVSKLQEYIENNMYEMNEIKISSISASDDYYVCICTLSNLQTSDQSKSMNIIVKLVDYSNFEISFSFN